LNLRQPSAAESSETRLIVLLLSTSMLLLLLLLLLVVVVFTDKRIHVGRRMTSRHSALDTTKSLE